VFNRAFWPADRFDQEFGLGNDHAMQEIQTGDVHL
jgi:hypothetical protein